MRRLMISVVVALAVGVLLPTAVVAAGDPPDLDTSGTGLDQGGLGLFGRATTSGTNDEGGGGGGGRQATGGGGGQPTAYWEREYIYLPDDLEEFIGWAQPYVDAANEGRDPQEVGYPGVAGSWCLTDDGRAGLVYRENLVEATTGNVLDTRMGCAAAEDLLAGPEAVLPPEPPSTAEVWEAVPIDPADIRANPSGRGLTGLASWFWVDDAASVAASAGVRGWSIEGEAHVTEWRWQVEGAIYVSTVPGSEESPAVEHVFDVRDTHQVSVERAWSGSFTVSGYGVSYTIDGLSTEDGESVDYEVIEVRGVLDEAGR